MFPRRAQPLWYLHFEGASSLARLGFLETSSRAVVSGVVPLVALDSFGDKQSVSWAYLIGAAMALVTTLNLGTLERLLIRRWVTTLGFISLLSSAAVLTWIDGAGVALGIGLLAIAASVFATTLSLYIMESVSKADLRRSESTRMMYAGAAWLLGPAGGVWLYDSVGEAVPFLVSAVLATLALGYFWALRLGTNPILTTPTTTATNPIRTIPRYFKQRYLRIAYAVTLVRAMFWVTIFVYGSIYVVETGLPTWASGVFLSSIAALLFLGRFVSALADRITTRRTISIGFGLIALGMVALVIIGDPTEYGLAAWIVAAVGASMIDVLGNIPFMRTVKPRDRVAMTTVFSTWRDVSALVAPAIAGLTLVVFPFAVFYLTLAGASVAVAVAATWLPRRI